MICKKSVLQLSNYLGALGHCLSEAISKEKWSQENSTELILHGTTKLHRSILWPWFFSGDPTAIREP